jgi:hypothetical protein
MIGGVVPIEDDRFIKWIDINSMGELLVREHHFWAVKRYFNQLIMNLFLV